ncbi:pyridoxal-phosphate dependent enzyme, partial [Acinetobacter baumannii]
VGAHTSASGLRVPKAIGDFMMLDLIRHTGGVAMTVTDEEMVEAAKRMARTTGVYASPEGGATLAAAEKLRHRGWIKEGETV